MTTLRCWTLETAWPRRFALFLETDSQILVRNFLLTSSQRMRSWRHEPPRLCSTWTGECSPLGQVALLVLTCSKRLRVICRAWDVFLLPLVVRILLKVPC